MMQCPYNYFQWSWIKTQRDLTRIPLPNTLQTKVNRPAARHHQSTLIKESLNHCPNINYSGKYNTNFYVLISILQGIFEECFKLLWKTKFNHLPPPVAMDVIKGFSYCASKYIIDCYKQRNIQSLYDLSHCIRFLSTALGSGLFPRKIAKILPKNTLLTALTKGISVVIKGQLGKELKYILGKNTSPPQNLKNDSRLSQLIGATVMSCVCNELLKKTNAYYLGHIPTQRLMLLNISLKAIGSYGGPNISARTINLLNFASNKQLESITLPTTINEEIINQIKNHL